MLESNSVALNGGTLSIAADISLSNLFASAPNYGVLSIDTPAPFTAGGTNVIDLSTLASGSVVRLIATNSASFPASLSLIPGPGLHMLYLGGTFTDSATIADVNGAPTNVEYGGGGSITLNGTSSYTGTTYINNETVALASPVGFGGGAGNTQVAGGNLYLNASTSEAITITAGFVAVNPAAAGGTGPITVAGGSLSLGGNWGQTVTVTGGTVGITAQNLATPLLVNGGNVFQAAASTTNPITLNNGLVTISTALNGTVTLNGGTLTQAGTSTFSTATLLMNGGILSLNNGQSFPALLNPQSTGGIISINSTSPFSASLDFSAIPTGTGFLIGSPIAASIQPPVTLIPDGADHTLHFGGAINKGTLTIGSTIADVNATPTNIIVDSPMTVILTTANTYSGTTVVNGFLQVNNSAGLGSGTGTSSDGTTVNPGGTLVTGPGVTLAGEQLTINGGYINVTSTGPVVLNAPSILGGTLTGPVSGGANFSVSTPLLLSGINTFSGQIDVLSGGSLTAISPGALGSQAGVTINTGGTLTIATGSAEPLSIVGGRVNAYSNLSGNILMSGGTFNLATGSIYSGNASINAGIFFAAGSLTGNLALAGSTLSLSGAYIPSSGTIVLNNSVIRGSAAIFAPIQLQGANNQIGDGLSSLNFVASPTVNVPWNFGDPNSTTVYGGSVFFSTNVHLLSEGMNINNGSLYFDDTFTSEGSTNINSGWVYFSGTSNTFNGSVTAANYGRANFNNATFNSNFSGSSLITFTGTTTFNGPAYFAGPYPNQTEVNFQGPAVFNGPVTLGGAVNLSVDLSIPKLSVNGLVSSGGHVISSSNPVPINGAIQAWMTAPEFDLGDDGWAQLTDIGPGGPINVKFGALVALVAPSSRNYG